MMSQAIQILMVVFLLLFIISAIPYARPQKITLKAQKKIEADLKNLFKTQDKVRLIDSSQEALELRLALIQSARQSLDISTYIVLKGQTTNQIFAEVIKAAQRGVKVRLISDGKFGQLPKRFGKALSQVPNVEVYLYNPFSFFKIDTWQCFHHEKHLIVDGQYLVLGGRNFGDVYFKEAQAKILTVDDYDVLIHGGNAARHMRAYVDDFIKHPECKPLTSQEGAKNKAVLNKLQSISNPSFKLEDYLQGNHPIQGIRIMKESLAIKDTAPKIAYALHYLSQEAKERILLQSPYTSPHPQTLKSLKSSVERQIQVTLLTNSIASSLNFPAFSNYYKNRKKFVATGIDLYEFQSTGLHSQHGKIVVFDDLLVIGSLNLDDRSFFINTETMVFLTSEGLKQEILDSFNKKLEQSYHVSSSGPDGGYLEPFKVGRIKRVLMYVASLFSRLFSFLV